MNRYLTSGLKQSILPPWEREKVNSLGRHGSPDLEIIPLCDALNALPGVCTLQSCAGHKEGSRFICGHLWLVLDESTSHAFEQRAFELAYHENIEWLSKVYSSWGQEVVCIEFLGNERGLLQASMEIILRFFESL